MQFEEHAPALSNTIDTPTYDDHAQMSFMLDELGQRVPYIDKVWSVERTQSITHVAVETTDVDPSPSTATATKVRAETTDSD